MVVFPKKKFCAQKNSFFRSPPFERNKMADRTFLIVKPDGVQRGLVRAFAQIDVSST
jgi:hypothetical protein